MCLPLLLMMVVGAGCELPRDPRHTLDHVRGKTMRVGITVNEPWVALRQGAPSGVEVELVKRFAQELGAEIVWVEGTESELIEALKHFELDLVVGGLTLPSPWAKQVGTTRPYFTSFISVGVASPDASFQDLSGRRVAVQLGDAAAALLAKKEAVPVRVHQLSPGDGPMAAPDWQLAAWGLHDTGLHLKQQKFFMAVPPGENEWLDRLERFLFSHRPSIARLLQERAAL